MSQLPMAVADAIESLCTRYDGGFFVYDLDGFERHVKQLVDSDLTLWYALKANPLSSIIKVLAKQGVNFDVASIGELEQVLAQGVEPERILHTGPAKSARQLEYFLTAGVRTYVIESIQQLTDLNRLAAHVDFTPKALLRVQLRWQEDEGGYSPLGGCALTPFGLSPTCWLAADVAQFGHVAIDGLHIFQWGNILSAQRLGQLWQAMVAPLNALAKDLGIDYQVLDLGGGLGIAYEHGQVPLNWHDVKAQLAVVKSQTDAQQIWMELGRYAIGEFGYYVVPVVERKTNQGQAQLILAGGVNHLLRPAIAKQPFPASLLRPSNQGGKNFAVYGPLCTGLDKLGEFELPQDVAVGDFLVFAQCGAYGFTESMPFFLCHTLPAEAVVYHGECQVLRDSAPASSWLR